jgi:hypothetical protein
LGGDFIRALILNGGTLSDRRSVALTVCAIVEDFAHVGTSGVKMHKFNSSHNSNYCDFNRSV